MEIKAELNNATEEQKVDFIVTYNHQLGYEIEQEIASEEEVIDEEGNVTKVYTYNLKAWGFTAEEKQEQAEEAERERIASLNLTKADFWIALLDGGITKEMVKEKINLIPDEVLKAKTLIRLDEADHFWRGDAAMDIIGAMFGLTPDDLTYLFENKELPRKEELELDNIEESEEL